MSSAIKTDIYRQLKYINQALIQHLEQMATDIQSH